MKNLKPILFSTPMVQANLRDEKTQTRRIIKHKNKIENITEVVRCIGNESDWGKYILTDEFGEDFIISPKYNIGDILWVRETWQHTKCLNLNPQDENYGYVYKADCQPWEDIENWKWKPSIFMPKEACRMFLKLTNRWVERLNDISENDSLQEGIQPFTKDNNLYKHGIDGWEWQSMTKYAKDAYKILWEKINGKGSWDQNPFVWVYEFERTDFGFSYR